MSKKLPQINHNEFADIIRDKQAAEIAIKEHDADARKARAALSLADAKLRAAMGKHEIVQCGDLVLSHVAGKPSPGMLTLADGGKVPLATVTAVLVGVDQIRQIDARDVTIWYGGRDGSDKIEIRSAE